MVFIQNTDNYIVKLSSLIADYDKDTLSNLYQPIIGYVAFGLYLTLWTEAKNQKLTNSSDVHETLLARTQMSNGEFIKARKKLEALGLLVTYLDENNGVNTFTYELFSPKTPSDFFNDTLLYGLLINYIGESDANKLKDLYQIKSKNIGKDISAGFEEVYRPNFDNPAFLKAIDSGKNIGRTRARIKTEFSYEGFLDNLSKVSQISSKALSQSDLKEIKRLSTLYGVSEEAAASVVADNYNPSFEKGKRIDFIAITKAFQEETNYAYLSSSKQTKSKQSLISSEGVLANKINMMETVSPKDWLSILQNGTKPASPDLKIIDMLSSKFQLNNGVINVIVDFVLGVNNNVLSRAYCEKIAASLARENIESAYDAMSYLKKINKSNKRGSQVTTNSDTLVNTSSSTKIQEKTVENEDEAWDQLISELTAGEDNNG